MFVSARVRTARLLLRSAATDNLETDDGDERSAEQSTEIAESQDTMNRKERRRENRRLRNSQRNRLTVRAPEGTFSIPKKEALSQHFLKDAGIIARIVDAAEDPSPGGRCVVELGPGLGSITGPLLRRYPEMTAIELDAQVSPLSACVAPSNTAQTEP